MSYEIYKTKSIGFCSGVRRAVETLYETLDKHPQKKIYTYGSLIHNDIINNDLKNHNVTIVDDIDDISPGSIVFIRTHGVEKKIIQQISTMHDVEIRDLTCPKVKRIHHIAELHDNIIVAGDITHPEVIGIVGNCKNFCTIVKDIDGLKKFISDDYSPNKDYVFLSQTTFNAEKFANMCNFVESYKNIECINTICMATHERQDEVRALSHNVDAMIIIGGSKSSNTKKLYDIAKQNCSSILISDPGQIPANLNIYKKIGLSAGTSTDSSTIEEVITNMVNENDENGLVEEDIDFAAAIDASMKIIHNGQRVTGTVTNCNGTEVQVDLGTKHSGFIPMQDFENDEVPVKVGDEVESIVVKVNDAEGIVQLSKSRIDSIKGFEKLEKAKETGEICQGKVSQAVKGGIIVLVNKIRVFVPASHVSLNRNANLDEMVGKDVRLKIIESETKGRMNRIIGSIRNVLKEEKEEKSKAIWSSIEEGKEYTGVVKSITAFGAFVDIGGVDGLVHITDLTWDRSKRPSDIVSVGDTITVTVKSFDEENKRISLSYKKTEDNPWEILKTKYKVGDILDVTVLKIMAYGAFVSVIPGIDGLIHISQISNERIEKVADALSVGTQVKAKITEIDFETKRISLSIKAIENEAAESEEQAAE